MDPPAPAAGLMDHPYVIRLGWITAMPAIHRAPPSVRRHRLTGFDPVLAARLRTRCRRIASVRMNGSD